ncbi:hypothetical protein CWI38_0242p0040 [Hamiltosporidium tvaerminnensis]|uniref:Uncharacterized protein n=1 Tax=Hamiltosporidium tvaerminnensis TaxID=1176355 RepID=A0A4Q9LZA5_9MICR|nr:hypothetical protein CWI38_0242p0040 [Hamiltosporidium tvaerminnensis]
MKLILKLLLIFIPKKTLCSWLGHLSDNSQERDRFEINEYSNTFSSESLFLIDEEEYNDPNLESGFENYSYTYDEGFCLGSEKTEPDPLFADVLVDFSTSEIEKYSVDYSENSVQPNNTSSDNTLQKGKTSITNKCILKNVLEGKVEYVQVSNKQSHNYYSKSDLTHKIPQENENRKENTVCGEDIEKSKNIRFLQKNELNQKKRKDTLLNLNVKQNLNKRHKFPPISDSDKIKAIRNIGYLHETIEEIISKNTCEDISSNFLRFAEERCFENLLSQKIHSMQNKRIKRHEDLIPYFEFAKKIICFEKKNMKNLSNEQMNNFLRELDLRKFEENISNLKKYRILNEIYFFIYSYNKGSIVVKKNHVVYVSFMFKLLEIWHSNLVDFVGLKNIFCFKYNSFVFSLRFIFYNLLFGIENFDSRKHFYIIIGSLIYFNDIGGIKRLRHKKKIYCLQLNILCQCVFLRDFNNKYATSAIEFYKSNVMSSSESSFSNQKYFFKKFFLNLKDMDLIRQYIGTYNLMKKISNFSKIYSDFNEDLIKISTKYDNKEKIEIENEEFIEVLFRLETMIKWTHSKIIYSHHKLRDNFYLERSRKILKYVHYLLMKLFNQ